MTGRACSRRSPRRTHGATSPSRRSQTSRGDGAQLMIVTHTALDAALSATIRDLEALPMVRAVASVMRVEGEDE